MLDALQKFFRDEVAPDAEGVDETRRLQVATCALMLEIAWADDSFSDAERETVSALVRDRFGLDAAAADRLLDMARLKRDESTDLYGFTHLIKDGLSRPERLRVLESLWRVVYSDGVLEAHEDALVHKLAKLLGLRHEETIALKLRVRDAAS